jgi:guanylate kinase
MDQTSVFIVSAPSGSGKSTLVERLLSSVPGLTFSISYTTRSPRGHEKNGQDYFFIPTEEFQAMIEGGEFLEWAVLFGKDYYGTARRFLEEARRQGHDLVLDIDVQGAAQIKQKLPDAASIFILPPSRDALVARLRGRGQDAEEVIQRRLGRAAGEIEDYYKYDYVVINDRIEQAAEKLCAIVLAARVSQQAGAGADPAANDPEAKRWLELARACRTADVSEQVQPILETFSTARK